MVQSSAQHFSQQWPGSVFEEPFALNRTQLIANQHLPISCGQDLLSNYVQVRIFSKGRLHLFRSISRHPRAQQIQLANPKTSFQLITSTLQLEALTLSKWPRDPQPPWPTSTHVQLSSWSEEFPAPLLADSFPPTFLAYKNRVQIWQKLQIFPDFAHLYLGHNVQ